MIFVDTGFFFALSAKKEKVRNQKARELMDTLRGRALSEVLITTDHVVFETLTLIQTTVEKNFHARAVEVGEQREAGTDPPHELRGATRSLRLPPAAQGQAPARSTA